MAKAEIHAGICGFNTTVRTTMDGEVCKVSIESECKAIQKLAEHLTEVDPLGEISSRRRMPKTLDAGHQYCTHAACPVPVGIIKAIEVEAHLALPADATIKLSQDND
jgi:hypothetical protein